MLNWEMGHPGKPDDLDDDPDDELLDDELLDEEDEDLDEDELEEDEMNEELEDGIEEVFNDREGDSTK